MKSIGKLLAIIAFCGVGGLGSNCYGSQFSSAKLRGFSEKRMLEAAKKGEYKKVSNILDPIAEPKVLLPDHLKPLPARIDATDEQGNTIFHLALYNNQTKFCIELGDILPRLLTKQNDLGETPLHIAIYRSKNGKSVELILNMLEELLKKPMIGPTDGSTEAGEKVNKIINAKDKNGNNVLQYFAKYNRPVQGARFLQMVEKGYFEGRRGGPMLFEKYLKKTNAYNKTASDLNSAYQKSKFSAALTGGKSLYKPTPFTIDEWRVKPIGAIDQDEWRAKPKPQVKDEAVRSEPKPYAKPKPQVKPNFTINR